MKTKNDSLYEVIRYNPAREYFIGWNPNELHNKYNRVYKDPARPLRFITTGRTLTTTVVDTLWNEMLYNPVRFGTENPFEFDGAINLYRFFEKYPALNDKNNNVMLNISYKLRGFVYFIGNSHPEFYKTGEINDYNMVLKCDSNRKPNDGYMALACLVRCIHLIASQNMKDYQNKNFRTAIQNAVKQRHQNKARPDWCMNFVTLNRLEQEKNDLYQEILKKSNEITDTKTRIQNLSEYEPPVDTSKERALLSHQNSELQKLEQKYDNAKNQYSKMLCPASKEYE